MSNIIFIRQQIGYYWNPLEQISWHLSHQTHDKLEGPALTVFNLTFGYTNQLKSANELFFCGIKLIIFIYQVNPICSNYSRFLLKMPLCLTNIIRVQILMNVWKCFISLAGDPADNPWQQSGNRSLVQRGVPMYRHLCHFYVLRGDGKRPIHVHPRGLLVGRHHAHHCGVWRLCPTVSFRHASWIHVLRDWHITCCYHRAHNL